MGRTWAGLGQMGRTGLGRPKHMSGRGFTTSSLGLLMGRGLRGLVHGGQDRAVQWTAVSVHCGPSALSFPLWFTMHRVLLSFSHLLLSLLLRAHAAAPLPSLPTPLLRTAVPGRRRRQPNRHPGDFDEQLSGTRALHEHGGGTGEVNRVAWCPQLWFRGGVA